MRSLSLLFAVTLAAPLAAQEKNSVFRQPYILPLYAQLQARAQAALRNKDAEAAQKLCEQAIQLAPQYPGAHYNLACAFAQLGKKADAFKALMTAIDNGMSEVELIRKDRDLDSLQNDPRLETALAAAAKAKPRQTWPDKAEPAKAVDGAVTVGESNTVWDLRHGVFLVRLEKPTPPKDKPLVTGFGEAGKLLQKWYEEGTAAGHRGDFYDNHDADHSNLSFEKFPHLTRIEFGKDVTALPGTQLHRGLQVQFFYEGIVLGNASMAVTGGSIWRSMTRLAYTNPQAIQNLQTQYLNNHLYVYPEHHDHDAGHNGQAGGGFGDVFPANTPYVITSQGSSGSDRVFLDALACTLAAFRPEVKQALARQNALMPTVQMIFRSSNKRVEKPADYLTGKAHPSVFEGKELDVLRMVNAAHDIRADELPPLVRLRVVEEDQPLIGRDIFDPFPAGEQLFNTTAAVARVMRSVRHTRRMVVSAEDSVDLNKRPLTYHWALLRGDPKGVTLKKLDPDGKKVELLVDWQERRPIEPGSPMASNRIDIGVFVHNGKHYSAPAFITYLSLDNQQRTYDAQKRIKEVDYAHETVGKNYVDPLLDAKKNWRDEYQYDKEGRCTGWTRHTKDGKQEFTADGGLIEKKDDKGRASEARVVRYAARSPGPNQPPLLEMHKVDQRLYYEYASDEDRVGKIKKKTTIE